MRSIIKIISFLLITSFLLPACSHEDFEVIQPTGDENNKLESLGEPIATALIKTLKTAVKTTIDTAGVARAISVCNEKALTLTKEVGIQQNREVSIKRTSFKFRNPENKPDEVEAIALQHFESIIERNEVIPAFYTQKVISHSDTTYYFYKPMKMAALCLICHGVDNSVPDEVKTKLVELYPEDKATGYREGDFRGLIRVKFTSL